MKTENVEKCAKEGLTNSFISPNLNHKNGHQMMGIIFKDGKKGDRDYEHIAATCSVCNKLKI
jgi:hypothetical protein